MGFLYQNIKIEDHIKEGNMKQLFICIVLLFSFVIPLGSTSINHNDTLVWKYSPINLEIQNREKQLQCLAKNIYFEARNEPFAGQLAVALVTLNRVYDDTFPNTICEVVYQGIHTKNGFPKRNKCQFSWYCDGLSDKTKNKRAWNHTQKVANLAIMSYAKTKSQGLDFTEGAIYYHTYEVNPQWSRSFPKVGRIGQHIFYR